MRPLLLTLTLVACGRLDFEARSTGDRDDARAQDATDDGAAPKPTWVKACTGPASPESTFDTFPPWAIQWLEPDSSSVLVTLEGGTLRIDASARALDYGGIRSTETTVFRNRRLVTEVLAAPGSQELILGVDRFAGFGTDSLRVTSTDGNLWFVVNIAGVEDDVRVPYDPVEHRFWQVREEDGMVMFETSADDVSYVTHHMVPTPAFVDEALLVIGMGSETASSGTEIGRFGMIEACPI